MSDTTASKSRLPGPVRAWLDRGGLAGSPGVSVVPLTGDASDRRYFRVLRPDAPSVVLALHAEPFEYEHLPFVLVARLLRAMPVPIPELLGHADDLGVLVQQDLGDVTLQAHLGAASPAEHARLYREAVSFVEVLQRRGAELSSSGAPPYGIAFDVAKLLWELEFFTKHFLEAYRGIAIPPAVREALAVEWQALAGELAAEPRVLCHRDYHSRNLMLHGDRLYIIDFQDARLGPDTYDLVSLLRDSYLDLTEAAVDDLVAYFVALRRASVAAADRGAWEQDFRRRFDLMALQRNLKALGTFGYQTTARGNPVYIQYIPRTIRYAAQNLTRHARFGRLHELLAGLVAEFR